MNHTNLPKKKLRIDQRRAKFSFREVPQYYRCEACIYNIEGICHTSPTLDSVKEYLDECDDQSNCGRNRRK